MEKRMTEDELQAVKQRLDISDQTVEIARGVLVEQRPQAEFVSSLGVSRSAVSQAVMRVWKAHMSMNLPKGYKRVEAILPEHQAYQVKKWSEEAAKKLGSKT